MLDLARRCPALFSLERPQLNKACGGATLPLEVIHERAFLELLGFFAPCIGPLKQFGGPENHRRFAWQKCRGLEQQHAKYQRPEQGSTACAHPRDDLMVFLSKSTSRHEESTGD